MNETDLATISPRDKAVLMGLFLSRFDRQALDYFGFSGFRQAYNVLGYSVGVLPKSVQNYRDEFDPYFPNPRQGWRNRNLRDFCRVQLENTAALSFENFCHLVECFINNEPVFSPQIKSTSNLPKREFSANRLITGRAAEQYFIMNYRDICLFHDFNLTDTTNWGCGFDFRLTHGESFFFVEVKGLNTPNGNILMTSKEYEVAKEFGNKYCLFVVKNFIKAPEHQLYFNPILCKDLSFERHERKVIQITYSTNV